MPSAQVMKPSRARQRVEQLHQGELPTPQPQKKAQTMVQEHLEGQLWVEPLNQGELPPRLSHLKARVWMEVPPQVRQQADP